MMIFMNAAVKAEKCPVEYAEGFVKMFSCICPHVGEEIWQLLGHEDTIAFETWPTYDESKLVENTVTIGIQVNGKLKGTVELAVDETNESALAKAKEAIKDKLDGLNIVKEIYVPGKIINIVAK